MPDFSNLQGGLGGGASYLPGGGNSAMGQVQGDLAAARRAGLFDLTGNGLIFRQTRREAMRNADNQRRHNAILSRLMGLDPNQARVAAVGAENAASQGTADTLNQAQYGQSLGNQNYARGLLGQQLGYEQQRALAKYQSDLNKPSAWGQIGSIVGTGAGAFLGGPGGAAVGKKIFG